MASKPTRPQIEARASSRMKALGYHKPAPDSPSYAEKQAIWQRRLDNQIRDSEAFLTRSSEIEQAREDEAHQREQAERAALEAKLRSTYLASAPGTTEADFQQVLPDLLHRHRLAQLDQHDQDVWDQMLEWEDDT